MGNITSIFQLNLKLGQSDFISQLWSLYYGNKSPPDFSYLPSCSCCRSRLGQTWLTGYDGLKTELSWVSPDVCAVWPLHVAGASAWSSGLEYLLFLHFGAPRVSVPVSKMDAA